MMENQNEREEWNDRWFRQLMIWSAELAQVMEEAETLFALIDLAKSQIKRDPPE